MTLEAWITERGLSAMGGQWSAVFAQGRKYAGHLPDARTREILFRIPAEAPALRGEILRDLVRAWAAEVIPSEVEAVGRRLGFCDRYKRVSVRDQSTRWGSCSSTGTLSFNWRLVLLPWELHDYVILHEFGHFAHMNHSGDFWDFLHAHDEDAGRHDRALRDISRAVMALKD